VRGGTGQQRRLYERHDGDAVVGDACFVTA
jgi:hypothetical protein